MNEQTAAQGPAVEEIISWAAVDEALKAIGQIKARIDALTAETTQAVDEIKRAFSGAVGPGKEEVKRLEAGMEAFVLAHKEELDGKSKKLNHGEVKLREVSAIPLPEDEKDVARLIARIKEKFKAGGRWKSYVDESPRLNEKAIRSMSDEDLKLVGLKREKQESFSYKVAAVEHHDAPAE